MQSGFEYLLTPTQRRIPLGLRTFVLVRLCLVALAMVAIVTRSLGESPDAPLLPQGLGAFLAAYLAANAGFLFSAPAFRARQGIFLFLQLVVDSLAITAFVFFTGGLGSSFIYLHFILLIASSILLSRHASSFFASLAAMGLALVAALYTTGTAAEWIDPLYKSEMSRPMGGSIARFLAIAVALFVLAYLAELLATRLEMARNLNEEVLQSMTEGIAVFDTDDRIVFSNPEFNRLFSWLTPPPAGTEPEDVFEPPLHGSLCRRIRRHESGLLELASDEERLPMEIRISPLTSQGKHRGMLVLAVDLSAIKRAEEAEVLAQRFSAVNEMAAGLAHEIRNPLASVRGSIQEIRSEFAPGSPNYSLAQIVLEESDRLDKIISDFLQFARQRSMRLAAARLRPILEETRLFLKNRPDAARVEIVTEITDDPEVRCDADQVREVFLNLGINALAAMPNGGKLTVFYPCPQPRNPNTAFLRKSEERGVTVRFHDTGSGIPPALIGRMFEPFFTTKPNGGGLGLAIAHRIVESHMGTIWAENNANGGASLFVWLPLKGPASPSGIQEIRPDATHLSPAYDTSPKRQEAQP